MNSHYKLYLSIGLLLSMATPMLVCTEQLSNDVPSDIIDGQENQQTSVLTEEECDDLLHDIFENCFFNDNDKTRFSDIVTKMIAILQVKVKSLDPVSQQKCNDFIILLEKNKNVTNCLVWGKILVGSDLISLLPQKTQDYLNSIPNFQKSKALLKKL